MTRPPTEEELSAHEEWDHQINGWVAVVVAVSNFLPLFSPDFAILLKIWPFLVVAISLYFFLHTEPDVLYKLGSWLRAWSDTPTLQHRLMTLGAVAGGMAELALVFGYADNLLVRAVYPAGLIGGGITFYGHHHGDEPLIVRQHNIMAFLFIATGLTWLGARWIPLLAPLSYAWPLLYGILAYLFITYTEQADHPHDGDHDHEHDHDDHNHVH